MSKETRAEARSARKTARQAEIASRTPRDKPYVKITGLDKRGYTVQVHHDLQKWSHWTEDYTITNRVGKDGRFRRTLWFGGPRRAERVGRRLLRRYTRIWNHQNYQTELR